MAMKLEHLVQRVETRLLTLGKTLLQADEKADLLEELDLAQAEVSARKAEQARNVAHRAEVRARLKTWKTQAADLPGQIEGSFKRGKSSQALRQAMELERLRKEIAEAEAELPRLEQTIWSLGFQLRQMERRLRRVREQLAGR
jgi:chromosome segregation ATPase